MQRGGIDRTLRIVIGALLVVLAIIGVIGNWGWIGLLPIATGVFRCSPACPLLGIKTCRND